MSDVRADTHASVWYLAVPAAPAPHAGRERDTGGIVSQGNEESPGQG